MWNAFGRAGRTAGEDQPGFVVGLNVAIVRPIAGSDLQPVRRVDRDDQFDRLRLLAGSGQARKIARVPNRMVGSAAAMRAACSAGLSRGLIRVRMRPLRGTP